MSLLKIFRCGKKAEEVKQDVLPIIVPEAKVTESAFPEVTAEHNSFSVINRGLYDENYRISSSSSKEIMRLKCTSHDYHFGCIRSLPNGDSCAAFHLAYTEKVHKDHFICRLFVTAKGHYFTQYIYSNGNVVYNVYSRRDVQELVEKCEADSEEKYLDTSTGQVTWIVEPGTYIDDNSYCSAIRRKSFCNTIDGPIEIIDKKLYDEVYEVL